MQPEKSDLTPADLSAAQEAAEKLLQAVQRGDEAAAKALLIPVEGQSMDFKSMHESTTAYELGEPYAEGQQVIVEAKVRGAAQGEAPAPEQDLPLVIKRVEGAWKIDMSASINRMLGVNLEDMVTKMAEGLGQALGKGMEAMAEGLSTALSGAEGQASKPQVEADEEGPAAALPPAKPAKSPRPAGSRRKGKKKPQ